MNNNQIVNEEEKELIKYILDCSYQLSDQKLVNASIDLLKDEIIQCYKSIDIFLKLPTQFVNSTDELHSKSAFFIPYHSEIYDNGIVALSLCISANYISSLTLLRTIVDMMIYGIFYQCISENRFRNDIIESLQSYTKRIKKEIDKNQSSLNSMSANIYSLIDYTIFNNPPKHEVILNQFEHWGILENKTEAKKYILKSYKILCNFTHGNPLYTDFFNRIIDEKDMYSKTTNLNSLKLFCSQFLLIIDIALSLEISILKDVIIKNDKEFNILNCEIEKLDALSLSSSKCHALKVKIDVTQ